MKKLTIFVFAVVAGLAMLACSDDDNNNLSCDDATSATLEAAIAFNASTSANYSELCADYKAALETQIDVCGDADGDLQALIDDLGDCTLEATTGTLSMSLGSAPLSFDQITVTTVGNTRHVHGVKSTTDAYSIDFDVEVGQTGLDKITNFELRVFGHTYTPMIPSAFGNDWTSNITVNSATSVVGTFSGELQSTTATNIQDLLNGVVDLDF